ncbi:unnamed protein product [Microthlaspi erraticum]|uniref:Uncharacterized protein n=1 Tax=Microthlaspi erraticum TaxID=1685480 RepID=A0A6D2L211_9BRAS|nr:unnamed protein product [Microthlaspi erraticum]
MGSSPSEPSSESSENSPRSGSYGSLAVEEGRKSLSGAMWRTTRTRREMKRDWHSTIFSSLLTRSRAWFAAMPVRPYRESAPNAQSGWPRNECSALGQNRIRPTEVSAKVPTTRPITQHDPGNLSPRSATPRHNRARPKRASRETPRGRATPHVPRCIRPSRETMPASGRETIGQILSARPHRPTDNIRPDRSDSAKDPTVRPTVPIRTIQAQSRRRPS